MNYWQRQLNEQEDCLLDAVIDAHARSAFRNNYSSETVVKHAISSGSFIQAIAAGVLAMGGVHGPIEAAYDVLADDTVGIAEDLIEAEKKVPGWGNSFEKGRPDPLWHKVAELVEDMNPDLAKRIEDITEHLHAEGHDVYPNPACYTAAAAIILGIGKRFASYLFIHGRIAAWSELIDRNTQTLWEQESPQH